MGKYVNKSDLTESQRKRVERYKEAQSNNQTLAQVRKQAEENRIQTMREERERKRKENQAILGGSSLLNRAKEYSKENKNSLPTTDNNNYLGHVDNIQSNGKRKISSEDAYIANAIKERESYRTAINKEIKEEMNNYKTNRPYLVKDKVSDSSSLAHLQKRLMLQELKDNPLEYNKNKEYIDSQLNKFEQEDALKRGEAEAEKTNEGMKTGNKPVTATKYLVNQFGQGVEGTATGVNSAFAMAMAGALKMTTENPNNPMTEMLSRKTQNITNPSKEVKYSDTLLNEAKQTQKLQELYNYASSNIDNDILKFGGKISNQIGVQTPSIGLNIVAPGLGLYTQGLSAGGRKAIETLNTDNSNYAEALATGGIVGGLEIGTERMFSGNAITSGLEKTPLDELASSYVSTISNPIARRMVSLGIDMAGETAEEYISNLGERATDTLINKKPFGTPSELYAEGLETTATTSATTLVMAMLGLGGETYNQANQIIANRDAYNTSVRNVNLDTNNQSIKSLFNSANSKELTPMFSSEIFENSNDSYKVVEMSDGSKILAINPNANITEVNEQISKMSNKQLEQITTPMDEDIAEGIRRTAENNYLREQQQESNRTALQESARQYGINPESETIKQIQSTLSDRGIRSYFDETFFDSPNVGALYRLSRNEDGSYSREIVFNPNANEDTIIQEMAVHELTHDIVASKTDVSQSMFEDVMNYLQQDTENFNAVRDSVVNAYMNKYADSDVDVNSPDFQNMIDEELVAKTLQAKLGNQEFINKLHNENRTLFQKFVDWINDKVESFKNRNNAEYKFWKDIQNKFVEAYKNSEFKPGKTNTEAYSINRNGVESQENGSFIMPENTNKLTPDGKMTMTYVRLNNSNTQNYGDTYGQNIEPSGEYMSMDTLQGKYKIPGAEYGTIHFENPLILEHKNTGATGWKKDLSDRYNGLTGKELSNAIINDGYDAIMTVDEDGNYIEVVNLKGKKINPKNDTNTRFSIATDGSMQDSKGNKVTLEGETGSSDKTLLAIHNLSADKLRGVLELGGFPVPSIAITNQPHTKFGEISVIFNKNTINPSSNKANKVYGRDAYTTRIPDIASKINKEGLKRVSESTGIEEWDLRERFKETTLEKAVDELRTNEKVLDKYLKEKKIEVKPVYREFKGFSSLSRNALQKFINEYPELLKLSYTDQQTFSTYEKYYDKVHNLFVEDLLNSQPGEITRETAEKLYKDYPGYNHWNYLIKDLREVERLDGKQQLDEYATLKAKERAVDIDSKEYKDYVSSLISPMFEGKYVRNNKNYYTDSGTPRSFDQRYEEYTLENIVKIMNENKGSGKEGSPFGVGIGELSGDASKRFKSIEDIKANEHLLDTKNKEEYQTLLEKYGDKFRDLQSDITGKYGDTDIETIIHRERSVANAMQTIARKIADGKKTTIDSVIAQYKKNYIDVTEEQAQQTLDLLQDISTLPTEYFEAKPQRAVTFDEIDAVVIPSDTDADLKQQLADRGIKTIEYDSTNENARADILKSLDEYKFSKTTQGFDEYIANRVGKEGTRTSYKDLGLPGARPILPVANQQENNYNELTQTEAPKQVLPTQETKQILPTTEPQINDTRKGIIDNYRNFRELGEKAKKGEVSDDEFFSSPYSQNAREGLKQLGLNAETIDRIMIELGSLNIDQVTDKNINDMIRLYEAPAGEEREKVRASIMRENAGLTESVENTEETEYNIPIEEELNNEQRTIPENNSGEEQRSLENLPTENEATDSRVKRITSRYQNGGRETTKATRETIKEQLLTSIPISKNKATNFAKEFLEKDIPREDIKSFIERNSKITTTTVIEEVQALRNRIWNTPIKLDDFVRRELQYEYGALPRNLRYSENGLPVDTFYKELLETNPGWLDPEIVNEGQEAIALVEFMQEVEAVDKKVTTFLTDTEIDELTQDLINAKIEYEQAMASVEYLDELDKSIGKQIKEAEKASFLSAKNKTQTTQPIQQKPILPPVDNNNIAETNEDGTGKQRRAYKSIIESEYMSDEAKAISSKLIGSDTYIPDSNKAQLQRADERIDRNGVTNELATLETNALEGKTIKADDIAVGDRLIQYYSKIGDLDNLERAIRATAMAGTQAGRAVQAFSMLRRQSPNGMAIWIQNSVDKLNSRINGNNKYNFTQDMQQKILNSTEENFETNVEEVLKELGNQVPKSLVGKLDEWRYFSMLANPKTHIRNIIGNLTMGQVQKVKNKVAGAIESATLGTETGRNVLSKIAGRDITEGRTHSWKPTTQENRAWAKEFLNDKDINSRLGIGSDKYTPKQGIEKYQRTFKSDALENTLGKMFDINSKLLEVEDNFGLKNAYVTAFADYMDANNLTKATATSKQIAQAQKHAIEEAQRATFHQANSIATAIQTIENKNLATKTFVGAVLPFKKTPMNVAKTGFDYSPAGLLKAITYDTVQLRKGNLDVNTWIDNISQGLTGTGIAVIGYALAEAGILKASGGDDDKEKFEEATGNQNYAIKIGNNTYSLDWLAPTGIPLFIGAELSRIADDTAEKTGKSKNQALNSITNVLDATATAMNPMSEMSMISGLTSALKSYSQGTGQSLAELTANAGKSYVTQFVPTALGQIAKSTDKYERSTTTTESEVGSKAIDSAKNQIMSKIPGLRQLLPVKTDVWGNPVETKGYVENAILPWNRQELQNDKVNQELTRLYDETGDDSVFPATSFNKTLTIDKEKYRMTNQEFQDYKANYGKKAHSLLSQLIKSDDYKGMTAEQKQTAIEEVYKYAKVTSNSKYATSNDIEYDNSTMNTIKTIKDNGGNEVDYFKYKGITKGMSTEAEKMSAIRNSDFSLGSKKAIYSSTIGADDSKYNVLKNTGINIDTYLDYKSQKFANDETGAKKDKVFEYVNNSPMSYEQRLLTLGMEYSLSDAEQSRIVDIVANMGLTRDEQLQIFSKMKGFKVNGNNVTW